MIFHNVYFFENSSFDVLLRWFFCCLSSNNSLYCVCLEQRMQVSHTNSNDRIDTDNCPCLAKTCIVIYIISREGGVTFLHSSIELCLLQIDHEEWMDLFCSYFFPPVFPTFTHVHIQRRPRKYFTSRRSILLSKVNFDIKSST